MTALVAAKLDRLSRSLADVSSLVERSRRRRWEIVVLDIGVDTQIVKRRAFESRPADPAEYAGAVRLESQRLRHRFQERLMRAFLDPEVFDGMGGMRSAPVSTGQERLLLDA